MKVSTCTLLPGIHSFWCTGAALSCLSLLAHLMTRMVKQIWPPTQGPRKAPVLYFLLVLYCTQRQRIGVENLQHSKVSVQFACPQHAVQQ